MNRALRTTASIIIIIIIKKQLEKPECKTKEIGTNQTLEKQQNQSKSNVSAHKTNNSSNNNNKNYPNGRNFVFI